jgi:hypothetical protein
VLANPTTAAVDIIDTLGEELLIMREIDKVVGRSAASDEQGFPGYIP